MARKNVSQVFQAWLDRKAFSGGTNSSGNRTVWTDGTTIYSYNLPIVTRTEGRLWIAKRERGLYSKTTAQHLSGVDDMIRVHMFKDWYVMHRVDTDDIKRAMLGGDDLECLIIKIDHSEEAQAAA